ncbi:39S ribosomal protein L18 mitochondrial [Taenia solium]|eukprot:TsM_000942600 transcript=TsM_000942600 gene=TsM_000942600
MGVADKTAGWEFQSPRKDFWHKITLERSKYDTVGKVVHKTSGVVLSASTQESAISKQLYSAVDVSAAENIGRILAHRCHCMGITSVFFDAIETPLSSTRNKAFYDALLESGLELEEPSVPRPEGYGIDYDSLSPEEKRSLYPSLIEELRTTPDWGQQTYPYSLRPLAGKRKLKMRHQVLSKVREGYIWDRFYNRLVKPEHLAAWQVEQQEIQEETLGSEPLSLESLDEPAEPYVPEKWRFD